MAYSTSPVTALRMESYLTPLSGGGEVRYRVDPNKTKWFAYRMREALSVLGQYPELLPEVPRNYSIKVTSTREVVAVPKEPDPTIEVMVGSAEGGSVLATRRPTTVEEIVEQWRGTKMFVPGAGLDPDQLVQLFNAGQKVGFAFFVNDGSLTLLPFADEAAEFAWTPEDL